MSQPSILAVSGATQQLEMMALRAYDLRHRVIAHNIANVDSDGFRPLHLNFEEQLDALRSAVSGHASADTISTLAAAVQPRVEEDSAAGAAAFAEPGESLDDQLVALTQNTLDYEAMLTALSRLGGLNRLAITGT